MNTLLDSLKESFIALAVAGWLSWIAYETGRRLLVYCVPNNSFSHLERVTLGTGLGYGGLSFLTLAFGALKLWYAGVFWSLLLAVTLVFILRRSYKASKKTEPLFDIHGTWERMGLVVLSLFMLVFFVGDLTPEIFYDSLYYHLAVPNLYRISHQIFSLPTLLFSNFVLTIQMVYGLAITLGNPLAAKLLHGSMALLLGLSFISFGRRYLSAGAGILSAILFLTMPMVQANVMTAGIDVGWSFLQFLAAYALIRACLERNRGWIHLAGLFTGLSASCKYPGFPYIPIAGALLIWWERWDEHLRWKVVLQDSLHFFIPAILVLAPTLVKNMVFHGNPLYPFGGTHWGTPLIAPHYWSLFLSDSNAPHLVSQFNSPGAFFKYLFHPWFMTMAISPYALYTGPLYLLALPCLLFVRCRIPAFAILRRYAIFLWVLWLVSNPVPRYGLPMLALGAPLLAQAALTLGNQLKLQTGLACLVLLGAISNFYFGVRILQLTEGWRVMAGSISHSVYLAGMHPSYPYPPYEAIEWMNAHLPATSKILFIGEPRSFYTEHPVVPSSATDPQPIVELSNEAKNGAELRELLQRENITHLFFNRAQSLRDEGYGFFSWNKTNWGVFQDFWSHDVRLSWKKESREGDEPKALYVYEVLSRDKAALPHDAPPNFFERWAPR